MLLLVCALLPILCLSTINSINAHTETSPAIIKSEWISPPLTNFDCHGSSLLETTPGSLCAVWKGGPGKGKCNFEMTQNVGIWLSNYQQGQWSEPQQIIQSPNSVTWTPILSKLPSGELLLFYRLGPFPWQSISLLKRSIDDGKTWSAPEVLSSGIIGPTRSSPLIDANGMMICGSSSENGSPDDEFKSTACWIEMSSDGNHWTKHGPLELPGKKFGVIEPTLFHDVQGNLRMLCRDRAHRVGEEGWIQMATSFDGGKSWTPFEKTSLPNPDAAFDSVDLGQGRVLLVYNHSHKNRFPLSVALTTDGGDTWAPILTLENTSGEFPSLCLAADGMVHMCYSSIPAGATQRRIKHVVLDPARL